MTLKEKRQIKRLQDAHEAIRPTDITLTPVDIKRVVIKGSVQIISAYMEKICCKPVWHRLYMRQLSVKIAAGDYRFNISASKLSFDGFMSVYKE